MRQGHREDKQELDRETRRTVTSFPAVRLHTITSTHIENEPIYSSAARIVTHEHTNKAIGNVLIDQHSLLRIDASEIRKLGAFRFMHGNLLKLQDILIKPSARAWHCG
jgi:hypothetical protein